MFVNFDFQNYIKRLFSNKRASVAQIFALGALPLMAVAGASIDLVHANNSRQYLQSANDSVILNLAKTTPLATAAQKARAQSLMGTAFIGKGITNIAVDLSNQDVNLGKQLTMTTTAKVQTYIMAVVGITELEIKASSSALSNSAGSEVVFVLDTTASMAQNQKMPALKSAIDTALANMVDYSGQNFNHIKVGIVPFNTQVKVAPNASYNWVEYGKTEVYQYCNYADTTRPMWPQCPISWWNTDAVCYDSPDRVACKSRIKFYDKPVYYTGTKSNYDQIAISYDIINGEYIIRTHKLNYWWTNSTYTLTSTDENGDHYTWIGGTSGLNDIQDNSAQAVLDKYNETPAGYNSLAPFYWAPKYYGEYGDVAYDYGYGAAAAKEWDYQLYGNGTKRRINVPAITSQKDKWTGCLIDRLQPYDTKETAASPGANTQYFARRCQNEPLEEVMGLSENISAARAKVQSLQPAGYTNITIGVQFGLEVLSNNQPYIGGANFNSLMSKKYMVLVTDGYNNRNRFSTSVAEVDLRTALACSNAKAKGVKIFVVRLEDGDSTLLQNCATSPEYYYDLSEAKELGPALQNVFTAMNRLRLTK